MLIGAHAIISSRNADADRAFLRDVDDVESCRAAGSSVWISRGTGVRNR